MASFSTEANSQNKNDLRRQAARSQNDLEQNSQEKERFTYQPPDDSEASSKMDIVMSYLEDTKVVEQMVKFSRSLARSSKLPYNPYPVFTQQCLPPAEKFHMSKEDDDTIKSKLQNPLQSTTSKLIWGISGCTNVWGLKNLVQVVDPDYIGKFHEAVKQTIPSDVDVTERKGYSGQILTSLTSPLVLMGGFQPRPTTLQIRLEYVIYGEDVSTGLDIFVNNIISDIKTTLNGDSDCKLLYVSLTKPNQLEGTRDGMTKWVKSKIEDQEEEFRTEIMQSMQSQGSLKAEILISFDDGSNQHVIRGSKEYILYFIEVSSGHDGEKLISFGEHPYQTLLEGVYLKKADAETYLLTMQRHPANPPRKPSRKMSRHASRNSGEMKISGGSKQKEDDLDEVIKQPIRLKYLKLIEDLNKIEDCFRLIDIALVLIFVDRGRYNIDTLVDIYRFLHSTSCRFYSASYQNQVLVEFIQSIGMEKENVSESMLMKMFLQYKEELLKTLNPSLHERPSHQVAYHSYFVYYLNELEATLKEETTSTKQVIRKFLQLRMFCETVQLQLTEDALKNCIHFNVKNFLAACREQLSPSLGGSNKKKAATEPNVKDEEVKDPTSEGSVKSVLKHGVEDAEIMQQRFQYLAVEDAMKTNNHPVIMAKEGVLMQYLLNIRLDDVWGEYLRDIMNESTPPPNPYPRLVTEMRKAAHKMRLFGKSDQDITRRLVNKQPQIADRKLNLYSLPECGVFGLKSALITICQEKMKKVIELADAVSGQEPVKQKGKFQISSGVCLSGRTVFYGEMVTYVLKLELHHHFYIKGPLGSASEVLQLFSKVVSEDIVALQGNSQRFVMAGVFVDNKKVTDIDDITQVDLSSIILDAASQKSLIYLKLYHSIGWRYVPIVKHYMLQYLFVDNADDRHEAYFPENHAEVHQYVFLSKEEAVEYFQKCSEQKTDEYKQKLMAHLDLELSGNLKRREVLPAYRCFLLKCLIGDQSLPLADIWRVFHSPAAQVEYVVSLVESLRDLVDICFKCHLTKQPTPSPVLQNSKKKQKTEVQKKEPTFVVTARKMHRVNPSRIVGYSVYVSRGRLRRRRIRSRATFRRMFAGLSEEEGIADQVEVESENVPELSGPTPHCKTPERTARSYEERRKRSQTAWTNQRDSMFQAYLESHACHVQKCTFCSSDAEFRCLDCGVSHYFCGQHLRVHHHGTLHVPQKWKDGFYQPCFIQQPVWTHDRGHACESSNIRFITVIDSQGRQHSIPIRFCGCFSDAQVLIFLKLWPATADRPLVAFQWQLMEWLRVMFLDCKVALRNLCQSMPFLSDKRLQQKVKSLYSLLNMDSFAEFRHLIHQIQNCGIQPGTSVVCPSCPKKNGKKFISIDGIFGLKRWKKSGSRDTAPIHRQTFFIKQEEVDQFLANYDSNTAKSRRTHDCSNFQAADSLRSKVKSARVDETGLFGAVCRHEMPLKFFSLRQGERIGNAVFLIEKLLERDGPELHVLYDIACTLYSHLKKRDAQREQKLLPNIKLAVPVFHVYAHKPNCQVNFSPRRLPGFGMNDGEQVERLWSYLRNFASITKEMTAANRIDALTDALYHHSSQMRHKLAQLLCLRHERNRTALQAARKELNDATSLGNGDNACIPEDTIRKWIEEEKTSASLPAAASDSDWTPEELYAIKLTSFLKLTEELKVSCQEGMSADHIEVLSRKIRRLDADLKKTEKVAPRWTVNSLAYREAVKRSDDRKRLSGLSTLHNIAVDRWFLIAIKKRYSDGQAIAKRISLQINSICKKLKQHIQKYNSIEVLSPAAPFPENITYEDVCNLECQLWKCLQTSSTIEELCVPHHLKQQITDILHKVDRCEEEATLLHEDMKNFYSFISQQLLYVEGCILSGELEVGPSALVRQRQMQLADELFDCTELFKDKIDLPSVQHTKSSIEVIQLDEQTFETEGNLPSTSTDENAPPHNDFPEDTQFHIVEDIMGPVLPDDNDDDASEDEHDD